MDISGLRDEIAKQRAALESLEEQLESAGAAKRKPARSWYRGEFYTSYYVISGLVLGALAAWVSLLFNVVGAYLMFGDPLRLLRVYATFFGGPSVLTGQSAGIAVLLALILHSATGSVVGAPIHVVFSRYVAGAGLGTRLMWGVALGIVMWVVNFYLVLSWLQPMVSGSSYIVEQIPIWVAALTHITFTLTMLLLQPYWSFDPERVQSRGGNHHAVAVDA